MTTLAPVQTEIASSFDSWQLVFFSRLNRRFEHASAEEILRWAIADFGAGLSIGTSFGANGMVMIDMALRIDPDVDIFYIDTGYFFPETYDLIDRAQRHYQRTFRRITPALSIEQHEESHGRLYEIDPDRCCHLRKVEPLVNALHDSTAWVTALRRDQSKTRASTAVVRWNARHNVVKIAPLVHWSEREIWDYVDAHHVPYNALHEQSYPSIGCWPCTRAVAPGEDPRAGRWAGMAKTECGLHWANGGGI
jgi:phosphoadenosine phosphosulfate reductase